ncbi:phage tail protein [Fibrella sp. HMF5335]|uniref:Phage tail protein n=1 Tax=Fibrella rubiginis TaxID=2817060 RepID=A0A939GMF9_9BACT|nr:tail fiber protein [Fibrella rubiginis]MBO0939510.1 phage tail protein [Fibrella rubiginis]
MEPFVSEIGLFGFNFAPTGWARCFGQLLPISQNTALFSLLGTNYGGDGKSTFGLPDLQGRIPIGYGQGPGLPDFFLGEEGGSETITLLESQMPAHTHGGGPTLTQAASTTNASTGDPTGAVPAAAAANRYATTTDALMAQYPLTLQAAGGTQPVSVMQPYLTINYCIALQGIFPPRS